MALKPITRQEQIIVGKNLEPITRMERFLKEYGGGKGGSVQSDWNQNDETAADFIKNKPFGDSPTGGDTLYWDGNTEGLLAADGTAVGAGVFYRIFDRAFSYDEAIKATGVDFTGNVIEFDENFVNDFGNGLFAIGGCVIVVPYDEHTFNGIYFPTAGVWSLENTFTSITIPNYTGFPTTKKLETKYLPGAVILYVDDESYLYTTSDTSDTRNRMTKAELLSAMQSGREVFFAVSDESVDRYFPVQSYIFTVQYGTACVVLFMGDSTFINYPLYTAEYVPE